MLTTDLAVAYLIVITAGVARGFTGFVAGLVTVALLTVLYGPVEAIALSAVLGFISSTMLLRGTMNQVQWDEAVPLSIASAVTVPLGAILLLVAEPSVVKPFIGALVIAGGASLIADWQYSGPRNRIAAAAVGAVCGGVTGFTGSGGPLMVFYFLASPAPVSMQRANISAAVIVITVVMMISLLVGGGMGWDSFLRAAFLFPGTMFGTWAGIRLFEIAPQKVYQRVAQWALIAIGLTVLVS